MKIIKVIITLLIISLYICSKAKIIAAMKEEIIHLSMSTEESEYVSYTDVQGEIAYESFKENDLENKLQFMNLEESIKDKFRGIVFSDKINFDSFCYYYMSDKSNLHETIGVVNKENDLIEVGYITISVWASLSVKYDIQVEKVCSKYFYFFESCENVENKVKEGFTPLELNSITKKLRCIGFIYLQKKLDEFNLQENTRSVFLGIEEDKTYDKINFGNSLENITKNIHIKNKIFFIQNFELIQISEFLFSNFQIDDLVLNKIYVKLEKIVHENNNNNEIFIKIFRMYLDSHFIEIIFTKQLDNYFIASFSYLAYPIEEYENNLIYYSNGIFNSYKALTENNEESSIDDYIIEQLFELEKKFN